MNTQDYQQQIAVIGMAARFPGADSVDAFWHNLCTGKNAVVTYDEAHLRAAGVDEADLAHEDYVRAGLPLTGIELFDAAFFGFTPREAELMDPQRRLLIECAHQAMESAGYAPGTRMPTTGVYAGVGVNGYLFNNLMPRREMLESLGEKAVLLANGSDYTSLHISYALDLHGPSVSIGTACSTSLVAVHESAKSLLTFECDMALAGGATVTVPHGQGYRYVKDGIRAPDGRCRAFDKEAAGTVFGSGVGMVVLKRMEDALADRDTIFAVILASAVNNDGARKVGFTAPSVKGQADVIADALAVEDIDPADISYVEAHGTGTVLGDPIELAALNEVFTARGFRPGSCALGSVKTQIGHLDAAAGIAGFIKTVLALRHKQIPPSLHFQEANPELHLEEGPFFVNHALRDWDVPAGLRRAGVSAFGIGGTNAHVVLEEAPHADQPTFAAKPHVFVVSAKTPEALSAAADQLADHLAARADAPCAPTAFTLQVGRKAHPHRLALVADSYAEAAAALRRMAPEHARKAASAPPRLAFLFPGQGTQYAGMGRDLYAREAVFRDTMDTCAALLHPHLGISLTDLLYADAHPDINLTDTRYAQPAVFCISLALNRLLAHWGLEPDALLGHSVGDYVAAHLAGVFCLEDVLGLIVTRGRLIAEIPTGAMAAVPFSEAEVAPYLSDTISLAAVNGPRQCVLSGPAPDLDAALAGIEGTTRLHTSHAFHSAMMDAILASFEAYVARLPLNAPQRPMVSSLTGTYLTAEQAVDPAFWTRHLRHTVRFADGLATVAQEGPVVFLEVGPGRSLMGLAAKQPDTSAWSCMPHPRRAAHEYRHLLDTVGALWTVGAAPRFEALHGEEPVGRVPLPTYPFERRRFWIDAPPRRAASADTVAVGETPSTTPETRPTDTTEASDSLAAVHTRPALTHPAEPPATDVERRILAIWETLLGMQGLGVTDHFFDLGGDSLIAGQLLARLRTDFGIDWSLAAFFEAPTVRQTAAELAEARPTADAEDAYPLVPVSRDQDLPLSFAQQRLWFLDQLEGPSPIYNMPSVLHLTGPLDRAALQWSIAQIVRRHEVLRTRFHGHGHDAVQVPMEAADPVPTYLDVCGRDDASVRATVGNLVRRPFDLAHDPLFRVTVLQRGAEAHILVVTMHHIVSDGWSLGILVREFAALYEARLHGRPSPLPDLPVQYADFAHWQRRRLAGTLLSRQLAYWKTQLSGMPALLELPYDRPRPPEQTYRGAMLAFDVPDTLGRDLEALARREDVTLFHTLTAAYQVLLYRYAGQADFAVGTPFANRTRRELEGLIGFFVNTLVLRAHMADTLSFRDVLADVKRTTLEAYAHQDVPFEQVVEALQPERSLSHTPLFQVVFMLQTAEEEKLSLSGLTIRPENPQTQTAKFDLILTITETASGFRGHVEYNTDLFDEESVARLAAGYRGLLTHVAAHPDTPIAHVPIMEPAQRTRLLDTFNQTTTPFDHHADLYTLFARAAARQPGAVAVCCPDGRDGFDTLTYGELHAAADRIAAYLLAGGVGADDYVGLYLYRKASMIAALLGILKTGAAYAPLDISLPPERLRLLADQLHLDHVITHAGLLSAFADATWTHAPGRLLCLDAPPADLPEILAGRVTAYATLPAPTAPLACRAEADGIAYVIFTSGSTGTPKGVVVQHRPAVNLISWVNQTFEVGVDDRVLFVTSLSFDLSVYDVFGLLAAGGSLRIADNRELSEPETLAAILENEQVTFWDSAPAALQQVSAFFTDPAQRVARRAPRLVFLSGDWVPLGLPDVVRKALPASRVVALGGATEATIWSNYFPVERVAPHWASIPYGKPIDNARYYVLDAHLEPCPIGVPGDLFIGGACLAAFYFDAPQLTAWKFLPNPYDPQAGGRLYRTGDRARWFADGNLEFLGRLDHQVKIRGFRIELGEIEARLLESPAVAQAVVVAYTDGDPTDRFADKQLVAYLVPQPGTSLDEDALRTQLARVLPEYMVPAVMMPLETLPVTANGKLDRKALPAPGKAARAAARLPETEVERRLAEIWAETIGVTEIFADDDFFALGGHSLNAAQINARIRKTFQVEMPLRDLFAQPVLSALALRIQALTRDADAVSEALQPVPRETYMPLSFAQQRLWFIDQLEPHSAAYNVTRAIWVRADFDRDLLEKAFRAVAQRHEVLRTVFVEEDGTPRQFILPEPNFTLGWTDLRDLPEDARRAEAERLAAEEMRRPFDLEKGPLFRVNLWRLDADEYILSLNMHHIISDANSRGILVHEARAFYRAFVAGEEPEVNELPIQYSDYAVRQRENQPALDRHRAYWVAQLSGAPVSTLPTDRVRPAVYSNRGSVHRFAVDPAVLNGLRTLCRGHKATSFMGLLAGFYTLLYRYSGQSDWSVGSPILNRTRRELEVLVGFFVNTVVLRTSLEGNPSFEETLLRVRRTSLDAFEHQEYPFDQVVEAVNPVRDLSRNPLFQIMFSYLEGLVHEATLEDLEYKILETERDAAAFDITFNLLEGEHSLDAAIEYNPDLFDPATIANMARHYRALLAGVVADPHTPIQALPLLDAAERDFLLTRCNDTAHAYDLARVPVHGLIEARVAENPEAIALIGDAEDRELTYDEFNRRANRLAHELRGHGVGPDTPVAVAMDRGIAMVVALYAVLKAGGTYVPLSPEQPPGRLQAMLQDSGARNLLTQRAYADGAAAVALTTHLLDADGRTATAPKPGWDDNPEVALHPLNAAYMIYTSGSTGTPKGVPNSHAALTNRLLWGGHAMPLTARDRILQKTPYSFDVSVWELFWPLTAGAGLVIARPGGHRDPLYLADCIDRRRVTTLHFVPSMLQLFLEQKPADTCHHVERVLCSGETLPYALKEQFFQVLPHVALHNLYGPTEAAIEVTCAPQTPGGPAHVGIGAPIHNVRIHILDRDLTPCPPGVPGALFIGGTAPARGYHRKPALTAWAFLPDPFAATPGARLYRSGDLARYPGNQMEVSSVDIRFMGRIDHQVKLRGFRIEPGEIEAALRAHDLVADALVLLRPDAAGTARLAAYVRPVEGAELAVADLRGRLSGQLPDYMVPSAFTVLDHFPLNANGKVDRAALPAPDFDAGLAAYTAPRNETETRLAGIWAELLGRDTVGVDDDFFALGGHSLLATRVVSRVRDAFAAAISLQDLFRFPTVATLARFIAEAESRSDAAGPIPVRAGRGRRISLK